MVGMLCFQTRPMVNCSKVKRIINKRKSTMTKPDLLSIDGSAAVGIESSENPTQLAFRRTQVAHIVCLDREYLVIRLNHLLVILIQIFVSLSGSPHAIT